MLWTGGATRTISAVPGWAALGRTRSADMLTLLKEPIVRGLLLGGKPFRDRT
jgi:hypothetical protein